MNGIGLVSSVYPTTDPANPICIGVGVINWFEMIMLSLSVHTLDPGIHCNLMGLVRDPKMDHVHSPVG